MALEARDNNPLELFKIAGQPEKAKEANTISQLVSVFRIFLWFLRLC